MEESVFRQANGLCPYCNKNINVVEGLCTEYILDENAYVKHVKSHSYKLAGYCKWCRKPVYVRPASDNRYIVYPMEYIDFFVSFEYKLHERLPESKKLDDVDFREISKEDNPFIKNESTEEESIPFDGPYITIHKDDI